MKIMHVCQFLGVGGLEKVLYSLIKEQLKLGHQVEVIVYDYERTWVKKYQQELDIKVHVDYTKRDGYDIHLLGYLKKKIIGFDIVHTHDLNPMMYLGPLKLLSPGLKIVHTTHGMEHLDTQPKTKWYELFLGIMSNCLIAVSPKFKSYYQHQIFTNKNKVHLIDNGTDISDTVTPAPDPITRKNVCQELGLNPNYPIAIYVARVVPLKGQDTIIEFFKSINHQLLVIGPNGNNDYYEKCKQLTNDNIIMTGKRDDITRLLKASDYFISPSLHEGLPIAVLEAGAQGLPCLLSNIPGHITFNKENECVLIYNNTTELKEKTAEVLTRKKELVIAFTDLIQQKYSSKSMAQNYLQLYKDNQC